MLSSRLGLHHDAIEVSPDFDFWRYVVDELTAGGRIDYLICDEAQFYTRAQIDQLRQGRRRAPDRRVRLRDPHRLPQRDVRGQHPLVELADRVHILQVEALCWCGKRATHNARTENGVMVTEGEVIVVGDVDEADRAQDDQLDVAYEVLCRQHHRRRMTAARAKAVTHGTGAACPSAGQLV